MDKKSCHYDMVNKENVSMTHETKDLQQLYERYIWSDIKN